MATSGHNFEVSIRNYIRYFINLPPFLYAHEKSFFVKKSQSIIFLEKNGVSVWYIIIYRNDTFLIILQKVSWKYHKCDRSIMKFALKYHQISIKASRNPHKASCIIAKPPTRKKCPKTSDTLGTRCPQYGQWVPVTWSVDAHHLVPECPLNGHGQTA